MPQSDAWEATIFAPSGPDCRLAGRCWALAVKRRVKLYDWLGREDSNLRMGESKSPALPLGDAPTDQTVPPETGMPGAPVRIDLTCFAPRVVYRHRAVVSTAKSEVYARNCAEISEK